MKWTDTVASQCRYGEVVGSVFPDCDVLWEHSENDYQGFANVLLRMPDGSFRHYEWSYGSCSGCDEWESRDLTNEQIVAEVLKAATVIPDIPTLRRYVHLDGEFADAKVPTANTPNNGSVPGMVRWLSGGAGDDLVSMRKVVEVLS